jgi:hypothetical protein
MKKAFYLLLLTLAFPLALFAQDQEIKPVKFKKIKKEIKKKKSPFYYPHLFNRYLQLDTTLSVEEFRYLYYGFSFQDEYDPYGSPRLRDSLVSYLQRPEPLRAEMEVAARLAGELLKESPFRLRETFIAAVSFDMAGKPGKSSIYFDFFEKQVEAILSSGDGLTDKTAFVVIYIPDEYEILDVLGFRFSGQQKLIEHYDVLRLEENELGIYALYFDVSRLLETGFKE